ncbi:MAG TPA: carboxymuconolactone decarboxylase family protein [Pseudomonadales bacterium]|nr:carboxymuconolactone decarboxylase family protein [Pseudomonadales bacterium]HND15194.1 carboxymuconolactone decarboxylase family protein [Pseudomonadales bacterium]
MARIAYMTRETAPSGLTGLFEDNAPAHIVGLLGHAHANVASLSAYLVSLLSAQELDARLRELCILYIARLCACSYEWTQHENIARTLGVGDEEIARVRDLDEPEAAFDAPVADALTLCRQMIRTQTAQAETITRLDHTLGTRQLMELLLAANAYIGLATIMNACAIDPEAGMSQETALRLAGGTLGASVWGGGGVRNED